MNLTRKTLRKTARGGNHHMPRLRNRLTYANVAATLALVFAMSGGALAASKFIITSTKQIKPSVLSQLKGKAGANGAAGAQGPAGPAGPAGSQGPAGGPGAKGETGPEGKEGKEGKTGKVGAPGSPWTAGGTLPSGSTETGLWTFGPASEGSDVVEIAVSFPIPLAAPLTASHVHLINLAGEELHFGGSPTAQTACLGTVEEPKAESGNLCVYVSQLNKLESGSEFIVTLAGANGAGGIGAVLEALETNLGAKGLTGSGTWAVTG